MLPTQNLTQSPSKTYVHDISIKQKGVPRTQSELEDRCRYVYYLVEKANQLRAAGADELKIVNAFTKADQAQEGLYYLESHKLTGKGFVFDKKTGILTLSEKKKDDYQIGQKLSFASKAGNESIEINKIELVTKKAMEDLKSKVKKHNKYPINPLFDTKEDYRALQARPKTNATQVQEKKTGAIYSTFLKEWQDKRIDPRIKVVKNIALDNTEGNIYIFGIHHKPPKGGVYDEYDKTSVGTPFHKRNQNWEKLGYIPENNYLSIAYEHELVIPEDPRSPYRSVIHYLLFTIIEKCRKQIKSKNHKDDGRLSMLAGLESNINKKKSSILAYQYYQDFIQMKPTVLLELCIDLDNELKKALFHKFVGADGKPTKEGEKLIATGNVKLYGGCEMGSPRIDAMVFKGYHKISPKMIFEDKYYAGFDFGYPTYGMVFGDQDSKTKNHSLYGANKVGKCLMQLRKMLQETTANEIVEKPSEMQPAALIRV